MLDFFCPRCGDFVFEDLICISCTRVADGESARSGRADTAAG
jgi:hypothetical protein